jgi:hypothetical protein
MLRILGWAIFGAITIALPSVAACGEPDEDVPPEVTAAPATDAGRPGDLDGDGVPDEEDSDMDGDGLTNVHEEGTSGTDPRLPDSDGDALSDADEVLYSSDPHNDDTDGDGWTDGAEAERGSDPTDEGDTPLTTPTFPPDYSPRDSGPRGEPQTGGPAEPVPPNARQ